MGGGVTRNCSIHPTDYRSSRILYADPVGVDAVDQAGWPAGWMAGWPAGPLAGQPGEREANMGAEGCSTSATLIWGAEGCSASAKAFNVISM